MHPLYDPEGNKENLKAYLRNDLTNSFALNPVTGGPNGPWYQVNQEKIIDYGEGGKAHLELRREFVYNGIMPDLNARRYMNYMRVYALTAAAGQPDEKLPKRAAMLKEKLKELWNDDAKWYDFINKDGVRDIRYTVQMFKFLNSPVIDDHEREGLCCQYDGQ